MPLINTPRFKDRSITLETCFEVSLMNKVWQKIVKQGMRGQNILCLHDYYDFHRNHQALNVVIRDQIIRHRYKPRTPHIIRLEKKYGVCRHIQIPDPGDAVVLETLVESLAPCIKSNQPTSKAFYSRSHSKPKSEEDIDESFSYNWWELWGEFQKNIYEFTDRFDYVVVTDIANYFDTISFERLRNVLSSYGKFDECLIDFLFFMLDSFIWKPDYLPLSGLGLPQINFDAPRLLAHAFLFEIDKYLNQETQGNFVRWMDDIDFGVQDINCAKKILRGLDELFLTRGLRLNLGKTKILSAKEAKEYFLPDQNRYLTILSKRVTNRNFLEKTFAETGQLESLRILYNLNDIRTKPLSKPDRLYMLHNSKNSYYPLSKFLIALDILNCQDVDLLSRQTLRDELVIRIQDPIYIQEIKRIRI